ncbi:MAG: hypothetical protein JNK82_14925 [Myxococcaceae bacterium]|nr:hypothetical protein [Myxococcaceae bacterium]
MSRFTGCCLTLCAVLPLAALADEGHDKFSIMELKLSLAIDEQKGFTCEKVSGKDAQERRCVKFMDPRCEGKATGIGTLRYGETAPRGCYLDPSSVATYLDGKLMQTPNTGDASDKRPILKPLLFLQLVGTASKPSKVYRMRYFVAPDELSEGSKLYQALTARYGEPSYKNPPNDMRWKHGDTSLRASCTPHRNCELLVEDSKFEQLERKWQEDADAKERQKAAPEAPKL